jgi:hypothetical protein
MFWVRKLMGKPAFFTIADCESEARRIHICYEIRVSFRAVDSKALRIHSDFLCGDLAIAACISLSSSGESLACISMPLNLALGTFGLPIFLLIKTLCMTQTIVDEHLLYVIQLVNKRNDMANILQQIATTTTILRMSDSKYEFAENYRSLYHGHTQIKFDEFLSDDFGNG